ncbi:methionyl-tRNA formyltransferase [Caldisericum exile]|uniref:Methionyl-tRNA formyltransferase n=1 Tax=Caldisericum exile (strain DSM 21853 / NBRC 104410 / AZM16c01) TaxID=511051 RepID=A0A7U6GEP0_CALEA|nr:methionyl-tRNA formyltransferase [Caldisericum exile]BAL80980.1 methionyl-tRNA formyltransferase [Caldisericum exile AZM16c01]
MRIAFFSGSEISIPFAENLLGEIVLFVTLSPKIRGRGNKVSPNPVKLFADEYNKAVLEIENFSQQIVNEILSYKPDALVVFSFGKIIPKSILELTKCPLNIHPSDLPMYRGASPIERQLMDGVSKSAVTIIKMNEEIDKGEILLKKHFDVSVYDDYFSFLKKVYDVGIPLLREALECCLKGMCSPVPQVGEGSYAKKIRKEEEKINWKEDAFRIHNRVRALTRIGAYTIFREKKLKIFKTDFLNEFFNNSTPGTIVYVHNEYFLVSSLKGCVKILRVQPEGKKIMDVKDFINGYKPKIGEVML